MPQPIIPIHKQESLNFLFEGFQPEFPMSEIQSIVLQPSAADLRKPMVAMSVVKALEEIDKNTDIIVTAVSESSERFCSVPHSINDNTLLALKAEGLVSGYGRSVKMTDRGRTMLRDCYLNKKNSFKENRASDKYDYNK